MLEKGLLKISNENRVISAKGLEIANFGGWLSYKKQLHKEGLKRDPKTESEKRLAMEVHQLQKENVSLKAELKQLNEKETATFKIIQSLVLQNRTNTILLLLAGAAMGFILANLRSILQIF
jgi:Mg2+ and Co2+ transporter CorA